MGNIYDLDIAIEVVVRMRVKKENELDNVSNPDKRKKIQKEIDVLQAERYALYTDPLLQESLIDKALNYYAPILKAEHTTFLKAEHATV